MNSLPLVWHRRLRDCQQPGSLDPSHAGASVTLPAVGKLETDREASGRQIRVPSGQIPESSSMRWDLLARSAGAVLLMLPLVLYVAVPTRNFYWDGVAFAIDIEKHPPIASLVHPSHLVYAVWGAWVFGIVEALGINARALFVLQAANGVLAGLCVILLYRSLRARNVRTDLALAGAFLFAFSATWWKFAADANAYVPSILLLVCADLLLERRRPAVAAGFAHAGAMLFHELAILFLPVALFRLRKNRRSMAIYLTVAFLPVVLTYVLAYRAAFRKMVVVPGLLPWITSHAPNSGFSFNLGTNAVLTSRGTARLLFGGKLSDFAGDPIAIAACVSLILAAAAIFSTCVWRAIRDMLASRLPSPPLYAALWAGIYIAFLFFWMPMNTFYRLFYLPPLVVLVMAVLRPTPRSRDALWAFAAVVLLWNFSFLVYPLSRADHNVPLRFALAQHEKWRPGTPIVFHRFHPDLWIISYFNQQASWITLEQVNLVQLEESRERARSAGNVLWLEETAYDLVAADPSGQRWLALYERRDELLDFRDAKHRFTFHCVR